MSKENVERLRDAYEAWNRGAPDLLLDNLHPEVEFHQAAGFPGMGVYRGPEAVASALDDLTAAFADFKAEPEKIIDLEDGRLLAFVRLSGFGRGSGAPFEVTGAHLFTPAPDGRLLRFEAYFDRAEALEAAGLRGSGG
jgi:ketosteroid isomerase-like protein